MKQSKTHYHTSDGERISKTEIDHRVREVKRQKLEEQLNDYGYNFCVECVKKTINYLPDSMNFRTLDCSHIKSVDECQKTGHSELAWDKDNIRILCRFHHQEYDKNNLKFKTR